MRILVFYRYYWPDTAPFGRVLASLAERWHARGDTVRVVTSQPGYKPPTTEIQPRQEVHGGASITRVRGLRERSGKAVPKLINHLLYSLQVVWFAARRRRQFDVIIVNSYPPILGGLTGRLAAWLSRTPFVYNLNDIHPESAALAGYLRKGVVYRLLRWLDAGSCQAADTLITMSRDMANTVKARGVARPDVVIRNVLLSTAFEDDTPPDGFRQAFDDRFVVLYAGNIGGFQGLDTAVAAARLLQDRADIHFVFLGDGVAKQGLIDAAGEMQGKTVHFLPFAPASAAFGAMRRADFGLSALRPGVYRVAYPSKTLAYLTAGCPVLALIEPQSALAQEVTGEGLGLACPQGDPQALADTIRSAADARDDWRARRADIEAYAAAHFSFEAYARDWTDLIDTTAGKGRER